MKNMKYINGNIKRLLRLVNKPEDDSKSILKIYKLIINWYNEHAYLMDDFVSTESIECAVLVSSVIIYEDFPIHYVDNLLDNESKKLCRYICEYLNCNEIHKSSFFKPFKMANHRHQSFVGY